MSFVTPKVVAIGLGLGVLGLVLFSGGEAKAAARRDPEPDPDPCKDTPKNPNDPKFLAARALFLSLSNANVPPAQVVTALDAAAAKEPHGSDAWCYLTGMSASIRAVI